MSRLEDFLIASSGYFQQLRIRGMVKTMNTFVGVLGLVLLALSACCEDTPPPNEPEPECMTGSTEPCVVPKALGSCMMGSKLCVGGFWDVTCVANVSPQLDTCGNVYDDDCDGDVNEDCWCLGGTVGECYLGPPNTLNVGLCRMGHHQCGFSTWSYCEDSVTPQPESCNGLDDDCDGKIDEDFRLLGVPCDGIDDDLCSDGEYVCRPNGQGVECNDDELALVEVCNGVDDDCNGMVDDASLSMPCTPPGTDPNLVYGGLSVCSKGIQGCGDDTCRDFFGPKPEICDGLDNDCDGVVDDGNPDGGAACYTGALGICSPGYITCVGGRLECTTPLTASMEICDGLDNDCDGEEDEGDVCCHNNRKDPFEGDVDCGGACDVQCAQGRTCQQHTDCATDWCIDGYCCGGPCVADCMRCDGFQKGSCSYTDYGEQDPYTCIGNRACNGNGLCRLSPGQPCQLNFECMSEQCDMTTRKCI